MFLTSSDLRSTPVCAAFRIGAEDLKQETGRRVRELFA